MSEGFTVQQQTEARERLAAATPGPWLVTPDHPDIVMKPDEGHPDGWDGTMIARVPADEFGLVDEANAQFIAHAPADLGAALDALDRVQALHSVEHHQLRQTGRSYCVGCSNPRERVAWPCATVRAIEGTPE